MTDLGVIDVTRDGLRLREVAPGFTPDDVQQFTEPKLHHAGSVREMTLQKR
jgi:acyl CoA:acetate/3-ketoacid CoA transferase beta subunit